MRQGYAACAYAECGSQLRLVPSCPHAGNRPAASGGRRAARHGAASRVSGARTSPARLARRLAPLAASVAVLALGLTFALVPQPEAVTAPTAATDTLSGDTQTLSVAADVAAPAIVA